MADVKLGCYRFGMSARFPVLLSAIFLSAFLAGCSARGQASCCRPGIAPTKSLFVVSHGSHAGLLLRRADIPDGAIPELDDLPDLGWIELGWGDADYYPSSEPTLLDGLNALFSSDGSVIHVSSVSGPDDLALPAETILEIPLCEDGFSKLVPFVSETFLRTKTGPAGPLRRGWYGVSLFYPSRRKFSIRNTCNTWVADSLRMAGCPVEGSPIVGSSLMKEAKRFGRPVDERKGRIR